jgi:adenine deaminase
MRQIRGKCGKSLLFFDPSAIFDRPAVITFGPMDDIDKMLAVARGDLPADLVLTGGRVVNVFTGEIESADVAISGSRIAGIGSGYGGNQRLDLKGAFLAPGFIDAHVHIESSLCVPSQFAAAVVPHGVTTVVTDPHEMANVAGTAGICFMAAEARDMPLEVIVMASSCVPATHMATSGASLNADDLRELRQEGIVHGLAEVMNFPAVISGDGAMRDKLAALSGRPIDGHCPGASAKQLNAYIAAGVGSDHESITLDEAREKLARGLYLLVREATNARNLDTLLAAITPLNSRRICFCTDDRTPGDLLGVGSVDEMVRRAIAAGIEPIEAIRMVTLNPAEWFGLSHLGGIAPGRTANLVAFDDLRCPTPRLVFSRGNLVARDGSLLEDVKVPPPDPAGRKLGHCQVKWNDVRWNVEARSDRFRVIGSRPDQLVTDHRVVSGKPTADPSRDLLKMAVLERHRGTGNAGVGFIQGFGLRQGAMAGTVAHDHHNLVVIGADDVSMQTAARAAAAGGGLAVAVGERVIAHLPLPVGGLVSDQPIADVARGYERLNAAARELGSTLSDPFMAMSFMGLEVIPALKLTDLGLVDVEKFAIVDLFV